VQQGNYVRVFPKVLRGGLNPARSFTNILRGEKPWYRDWQHSGVPIFGEGIHVLPSDEQIEEYAHRPRFELSPHYALQSIAVNTKSCRNCRESVTGFGIEGSYRLTRWLDADVDLNRLPNASPLPSDRSGGNLLTGFFGLRAGFDTPNYSLKFLVRPGFVRFDDAYESSPLPDAPPPATGDINHLAWNLAISGDYRIARSLAFRTTFGNTIVRYRTEQPDPPGIGTPPYLSWLSHDNYINRGNWYFEAGPVFRFGSVGE
jgi:hypothetical protein